MRNHFPLLSSKTENHAIAIYFSSFSSFICSADTPVISITIASSIPFASIFLAISKLRWVMPFWYLSSRRVLSTLTESQNLS